jgi:hypothetical protein
MIDQPSNQNFWLEKDKKTKRVEEEGDDDKT